jgi:hypothetical protein
VSTPPPPRPQPLKTAADYEREQFIISLTTTLVGNEAYMAYLLKRGTLPQDHRAGYIAREATAIAEAVLQLRAKRDAE